MTEQDFALFCYYLNRLRKVMNKMTAQSDCEKACRDLGQHGLSINDYMQLKSSIQIVYEACGKEEKKYVG